MKKFEILRKFEVLKKFEFSFRNLKFCWNLSFRRKKLEVLNYLLSRTQSLKCLQPVLFAKCLPWSLVFTKKRWAKQASNLYAVTEGTASRNVKISTLKCLQAVVLAKRRPDDQGFSEYRICVKQALKCPIVMFWKTLKFVNHVPSL